MGTLSYFAILFKKWQSRRSENKFKLSMGVKNSNSSRNKMNKNLLKSWGIMLGFMIIFFSSVPQMLQRLGFCLGILYNAFHYIYGFWMPSILITTVFFASNPSYFKIAVDNLPWNR